MRRLSVTTLVVGAPLLLGAAGSRQVFAQSTAGAATVKVGAPAPEVALAGADGRTYRLADLHGKRDLVLVIFRGLW